MRKLVGSAFLLLALALPALAEVKVKGEMKVPPGTLVRLEAAGATPTTKIRWKVQGEGNLKADVEYLGNKIIFTGLPGKYNVSILAIDFDKKSFDEAEATVVIGEPPPPGPGPDPGPGPKPPPVKGLKALILYESSDTQNMPQAKLNILTSASFRDWLDTKCSEDKTFDSGHAWTIQDKDTELSAFGKEWEAARKGAKNVPGVILMDGAGNVVLDAPLPENIEATKTLIAKYAPAQAKDKKGAKKP